MSAKRSSTIKVNNNKNNKKPDDQSKEYADEYERRYGEKLPDEVKNAPYKVVGRNVKKITKKIKDKIKGIVGKKSGGVLKPVPEGNTGLGKLPTPVRNKMGFAKAGGQVKKLKKGGKVKRMSCPVDGMAKRGKTKVRRKGR
jgi:hypothetical protein